MAYSYVRYTGNGSTTNFAFSFPYLSRDHISVRVNDVVTSFTFLNDSTVTVSPAPAGGSIVEVRRTTPKDTPIVNFTDGSVLLEADLDLLATYSLYIAQEADDAVDANISLTYDGKFDADNKRIINVADPVDLQDAATKNYVNTRFAADVAAVDADRIAAQAAAVSAAGSASSASTSANNAANTLAEFQSIYHGASSTAPTTNVSVGDLWFDLTTNVMRVYDGASWLQTAVITVSRQLFSASAGQTVFTVGNGYVVNSVDVFLNGVKLIPGADFTATDGSTITLTSGASLADDLEVISQGGFSVSDVGYIGRASFTGDGVTTSFNTGRTLAGRSSVWLSINGIVQHDSAYNVSGTNIVLTEAPAVGDLIQASLFGLSPFA